MNLGIERLLGKTLTDILVNQSKDEIIFTSNDGESLVMHHYQDCCETVSIDDINGNIEDLIGYPITL